MTGAALATAEEAGAAAWVVSVTLTVDGVFPPELAAAMMMIRATTASRPLMILCRRIHFILSVPLVPQRARGPTPSGSSPPAGFAHLGALALSTFRLRTE